MSHTLVTFHAHPDDESITTGGTMAKAAAAGHRVVLVVATRGDLGETQPGVVLGEGETLADRRVEETLEAAKHLGVSRVEFLGYKDSGMDGEASNSDTDCFWQASIDEAAARLAAILEEEQADVLTVYDPRGGYGHPDHVQVHRVGVRAGEMAGTPAVLEATMDRDALREMLSRLGPALEEADGVEPPDVDVETFGTPGSEITTRVDVSDFVVAKRAAMAAHASQIGDSSFFLAMPDPLFAAAFGTEWFVRRGAPPGTAEEDVFASLDGG